MPTTEQESAVTALQSRPGRTVFTEPGEPDAWIATDVTVTVTD